MMMTTYTTLVRMAPASAVVDARSFCIALAGEPGEGELRTGLVPINSEDNTTPIWYITDGPIAVEFAECMQDPELMFQRCNDNGIPVTLEQCQTLLGACVFAPGGTARSVMAEMGLEIAHDATTYAARPPRPNDDEIELDE